MHPESRNPISSARWRRIEDLYHRARKCDEADRGAFIVEECGGDEGLRREVESLLGYALEAEPFMENAAREEGSIDSDALPEGRELGSYKILALLGAGGMGKVYLGRDTRLGRTVAIKVLARDKMADGERKRRFMQEARAASSLNHPNIVTLYDIASAGGVDFLVMEYLEGRSLDKRISSRGLPLEEALAYAVQIAGALAAAHAAGIVHRDIKPANVIVSEKGIVKVLDFGLAKLSDPSGSVDPDALTEATRTQKGVILGTAAYMSPEQASGKQVDDRSDIFAVGVVLYEMLTGHRPFDRGTVLATLGAVMYEEPAPLTTIVKSAPPELVRILERCLRKDPDRRVQTMADLKVALEELVVSLKEPVTAVVEQQSHRRNPWLLRAIAGFAVLVVAVTIFVLVRPEAPPATFVADFKPMTTMNGWEVTPSWSENSDLIAFSSNRDGNMDIFVMTVAGGEPDKLTEHPWDEVAPRWSPNLAYMAYVADPGTGANVYLKPALSRGGEYILAETKLPSVDGGFSLAVQILGSRPWLANSQELLHSGATDSGAIAVFRTNVTTKEKVQLTHPGPGEADFNATWSFDGKRIAFDRIRGGKYGLWTMPADGSEKEREVLPFGETTWGGTTWSVDNKKILYVKPVTDDIQNIWEIEVDSGRPPRAITNSPSWDHFPIVSRDGRLAYVRFGQHNVDLYKVAYDPGGNRRDGERVTYHSGESFFPSFSPDALKLVYQSDQNGANDIYRIELGTNGMERNLTAEPGTDILPDWSPDGREIVYVSNRTGKLQLSLMDSEGGSRRTLTDLVIPDSSGWGSGAFAPRWSPDGRSIAFVALADRGGALWHVERDGSNLKEILPNVRYFEWYDNRHILFVKPGENGRTQVHTIDLESRAVTPLVPEPAIELDVSRDRTKLLFTKAGTHFGMNLWVQPLRPGLNGMPVLSGRPVQVTEGGGDWHAHKGAWSPDGKTIIYTRDSDQGNIYAIENYR